MSATGIGGGFLGGAASGAANGGGSMWATIIPAALSVLGMMFGNKDGQGQQQMTPEMREMLQMQLQRMRGQEPLYNDVMGMARSLLPTRYRNASGPITGRGLRTVPNPTPNMGDNMAGFSGPEDQSRTNFPKRNPPQV